MTILIHIRSMPFATPAVLIGGLIARQSETGVTLLRTREREAGDDAAEADLEAAAALIADLPVETRYLDAEPVDGILAEIAAHPYGMIVMRARRAIRYRQRLGTKVARLIAIESSIPVLVVKESSGLPKLKRILVCTGGKDVANRVIERAAGLARRAGAEITLLHVTSPVPTMYSGMGEIEETPAELLKTGTPTALHLQNASAYLAEQGVESGLVIRQGDVTEEILQEAASGDYDLMVIGAAAGDNRLREWLMGDVTRSLVNHVSCPLLVVR